MEKNDQEAREGQKSQGLLNLGKLIFLIVVLTLAWFLLDRIMSSK